MPKGNQDESRPSGKKERVKRTRAKPKNVIQKVIVNVGGRGGGGRKSTAPSGPPRPTPLQQATQFLQATQSRPPIAGESLIQSAQVLQRMIEPINLRLEALIRQGRESQPINITNPPINIRQPDIFVAPPSVSINQRFPDINIQSFPNMQQHREHNQAHVADLPDAPLVQPQMALVSSLPMRMDDPHEDVPLENLDPAFVQGKYEAQQEESQEEAQQEVIPSANKKKPKVAPAQPASVQAQLPLVQSTKETLLEALRMIEQSKGVKGNQKSRQGFMTKRELIDFVANITGRPFSPSTSADYDRIKRKAITVIRDNIETLSYETLSYK